MSSHSHSDSHGSQGAHGPNKAGHDDHGPMTYVKIWVVLLGLFVVSVLGPMLEIRVLTLITAFGIAIVKALLVAAYFMHLNVEKRYIWYMLFGMLIMVGMFFAGVSADVMRADGRNWTNAAAHHYIDEGVKHHAAAGAHGGE